MKRGASIAIRALELTAATIRDARKRQAWGTLADVELMLEGQIANEAIGVDARELQGIMRNTRRALRNARTAEAWPIIIKLEHTLGGEVRRLRANFAPRRRPRPFVHRDLDGPD